MPLSRTLARAATTDAAAIAASLTERESFSVIFDRYFAVIHRYLARRAGREVADDLAATVFTVAFERRQTFQAGAESARPWLFGIATNLLYNERRREQRLLEGIAAAGEAERLRAAKVGPPPDRTQELAAALAGLDADRRDVLLLHVWGELSYEEIATSLGIPVGTVRSRLARARRHMQGELSGLAPTQEKTR